jgi:hypothetical protein
MVDLGCMTIPLSGDFNTLLLFTGCLFALTCNYLALSQVTPKGPAIGAGSPDEIVKALGKTMIAQAAWCIIYNNYVGASVLTMLCSGPWKMIDPAKQTGQWTAQVGRFSANKFEQSVVFLPCLWMYAVLVDYETAGALGILYCIQRSVYPFFYTFMGKFTFWFEHLTQIGYTINGTFLLGCLMKGFGYDYIQFAKDNLLLVPVLGWCIGVASLLPGIGPGLPWFALHATMDSRRKAAAEGYTPIKNQ